MTHNYTSHLKILGEGSYGDVHKTKLNKTKEIVAIKRNFVRNNISFYGSIKELDFLMRAKHPNIIDNKEIYFENPFSKKSQKKIKLEIPKGFKLDHIYFGMELGKKDGFDIIIDPKVTLKTRKQIILDLLLGLEFLHSQDIIHRDIKPSNFIQVGKMYKWCDFGMSLNYTHQDLHETKDITTTTFRAPEIIFGCKDYTSKIDIWSMGILIIEILSNGRACFFNLANEGEMDDNISNKKLIPIFLGLTLESITPAKLKKWFDYDIKIKFKNSVRSIEEIIGLNQRKINSFGSTNYKKLLDLISKMIVFNPKKRYSATQALNHAFFKSDRSYINKIRAQNEIKQNYNIVIIAGKQRQRGFLYFNGILSPKNKYYYYRERVMFHALRIYDQFLNLHHNNLPRSDDDVLLYIQVCYYIAIKLFVDDYNIPTFEELFDLNDNKLVQDIEFYIINKVLKGKIYQKTIYELVNIKMNEQQKNELYQLYGSLKGEINIKKIAKNFEQKLKL